MAKALKPGSPPAFTYHHNRMEAYFPIAVAILDAGLACSASLGRGRGFGVRREDMKKMILATRGKVFTADTLDRLVDCTRISEFASQ